MTSANFAVPDAVISGVRNRWPDRADAWANAVQVELSDLCKRFQARPRSVFPARYGYLVAADTPNGGIVLRSSPDPAGVRQAEVAKSLANLGVAPRVHEVVSTDSGTWAILEEVKPGIPLAEIGPAENTVEALVASFRLMRDQPPPIPGMPTIVDWLRERLNDDELTDIPPHATVAPLNERNDALNLLDKIADGWIPALFHGDTSPWNILADEQRGWSLIDPRGLCGEVAYDIAVLGLKLAGNLPNRDLADLLGTATGLDAGRVYSWMSICLAARV